MLLVGMSLFFAACQAPDAAPSQAVKVASLSTETSSPPSSSLAPQPRLDKDFNAYWYAGVAELTGYKLTQSRYGELHEGEAALIFVTEPFSASKQVKLDYPRNSEDKVSVLKLNFTKKFLTGIYPYSLMTSVFTPIKSEKHPHTLKVSSTSQEWCGHTFMQFNREAKGYRASLYSYFESEGDEETQFEDVMLEDEIWTRLRLDPKSLPLGKQDLMPSSMYLRLRHRPLRPMEAEMSLQAGELAGESLSVYRIYYPRDQRELKIYFQPDFPYVIEGWDESYQAPAWSGSSDKLTTQGRRLKTYRSPYWSQHDNQHRALRAEMGLKVE